MNKKIGLLISFVFLLVKIEAQTSFEVEGVVIDAQTKEVLSKVNVINVENESEGTTTNEQGVFNISIIKVPTLLQLSFVGYENALLEIKNDSQREFVIELQPTSSPLPEVMVSSKRKIDTVFFEPFSVVDYVFYENVILLLAYRNSFQKYILVALDEKTHEPFAELSLTDKPTKGLMQKCTGELFLITSANAYDIVLDSSGISLVNPTFLNDFEIDFLPCVLATENFLYFSRYFYQGQALRYLGFSRKFPNPIIDSLKLFEFPLIEDEKNIVLLIEETGQRLPWSGDIWDNNITGSLLSLQQGEYSLKGMWKVFYPKLNAPLFSLGSQLIIFNHFESELQFFTPKGNSIRKIAIEYHINRKWKKQVFFDEKQKRAYTSFDTRWGEEIRSINLADGSLGEALPIDLAFIEKAKVRNGYLYFLYKNTWGGERNRILHRMKIE